jgi:hypothetical protein
VIGRQGRQERQERQVEQPFTGFSAVIGTRIVDDVSLVWSCD